MCTGLICFRTGKNGSILRIRRQTFGFAMFCTFSVVNLKTSFYLKEAPRQTFRNSMVVSYSRPENSNEVSVLEDETIMLSQNVSQKNEVIGYCAVKTRELRHVCLQPNIVACSDNQCCNGKSIMRYACIVEIHERGKYVAGKNET